MKIAIVQTSPIFGETKENVYSAISVMENVNAELYILPELFNTGYNFIEQKELLKLAESQNGFTIQTLQHFTKQKHCYIVCGFAEKDEEYFYNSSALIGPEKVIGIYRKVHLFYRENLFFTPGNLGFPVFDLPFGKIGMMICFDWIYPEVARTLALKGIQLIAHPSNLVLPYCPDAMITRCVENRIFAATVNRVGEEMRGEINLTFIGNSEIVTPKGQVLVRLGHSEPNIHVEEIDLAEANDKFVTEYNHLFKNRRPDQYKC